MGDWDEALSAIFSGAVAVAGKEKEERERKEATHQNKLKTKRDVHTTGCVSFFSFNSPRVCFYNQSSMISPYLYIIYIHTSSTKTLLLLNFAPRNACSPSLFPTTAAAPLPPAPPPAEAAAPTSFSSFAPSPLPGK